MYVEQFWRCFEETGNIETYLDLKEYEKLYNEHTHSQATENSEQINQNSLDGMK
ncbi:MAG TPA: YqzL family protein [Epulopiscium sp.]|nr:YqzL family protein [Candidatus Epulonipiscium sp.]